MQSNAATAALLEVIGQHSELTGREVLAQLAEQMSHPDTEQLTKAGIDILASLQKFGIILGICR
jgi:hypothetical protein